MKGKGVVFAVLAVFLVLPTNSVSGAVNTLDIDNVREKEVLNSQDLQIINNFVDEAIQELVQTEDFTSIAKVRGVILARDSSNRRSAQAQYVEQFFESAHKYISQAFKQLSKSTPEDRKFKVMVNLLILIDGLENLRLADLALGMLKNENMVIRYWAVHSVTNPGITKQLNSAEFTNLELARSIAGQLKGLVENSTPEILALMAEFAADVNIPQAEDLLLQIADMRIEKYAKWAVDYELLDGTVLKSLCKKISSAGLSKPAVARRFGQLYSYAIQRYINGWNFLSAAQKHQLASVILETEKWCISKLLETPQSSTIRIKRAIENSDYIGLLQEHNRLLGGETKTGELPKKVGINWENPDGSKRKGPLLLPEPPRTGASK